MGGNKQILGLWRGPPPLPPVGKNLLNNLSGKQTSENYGKRKELQKKSKR